MSKAKIEVIENNQLKHSLYVPYDGHPYCILPIIDECKKQKSIDLLTSWLISEEIVNIDYFYKLYLPEYKIEIFKVVANLLPQKALVNKSLLSLIKD